MNEKKITLTFDLEQVANDILTKCNLISTAIRDEAMADIRANVMEPDNPELRSIINRSVTEAFGDVKKACQRYLKVGRDTDNNLLERMVASVSYTKKEVQVQDTDSNGHLLYDCTVSSTPTVVYTTDGGTTWKDSGGNSVVPDADPTPKMVTKLVDGDIDTITYEEVELELYIPNFNVSVTDALKSHIHKYVVDYTMGRFLQDQVSDKASEYMAVADGPDNENSDMRKIKADLNARERFNMRKPSWI